MPAPFLKTKFENTINTHPTRGESIIPVAKPGIWTYYATLDGKKWNWSGQKTNELDQEKWIELGENVSVISAFVSEISFDFAPKKLLVSFTSNKSDILEIEMDNPIDVIIHYLMLTRTDILGLFFKRNLYLPERRKIIVFFVDGNKQIFNGLNNYWHKYNFVNWKANESFYYNPDFIKPTDISLGFNCDGNEIQSLFTFKHKGKEYCFDTHSGNSASGPNKIIALVRNCNTKKIMVVTHERPSYVWLHDYSESFIIKILNYFKKDGVIDNTLFDYYVDAGREEQFSWRLLNSNQDILVTIGCAEYYFDGNNVTTKTTAI